MTDEEMTFLKLSRHSHLKRRRFTLAIAAFILLAGSISSFWLASRMKSRSCLEPGHRPEEIWNAPIEKKLGLVFAETQHPQADAMFAALAERMADYAVWWNRARTMACEEAQSDSPAGRRTLLLRQLCIESRHRERKALIRALSHGLRREEIERIPGVLFNLSSLKECLEVQGITSALPQPVDPRQEASAKDLEEDVAYLLIQSNLGRVSSALEQARSLGDRIRPIGFSPLQARYLLALGGLQLHAGDLSSAQTSLVQAADLATQLHDKEMLRAIWWELMKHHRARLGLGPVAVSAKQPPIFTTDPGTEQSIADRGMFGEIQRHLDETKVATLLLETGQRASREGQTDRALELLQRALALHQQEIAPSRFDAALANEITARLFQRRNEYDAAFYHWQRALELREERFGPEHPGLASVLEPMIDIQLIRGELEEGRKNAIRLAGILEKNLGPAHPDLSAVQTRLARISLLRREPSQALKLYETALISRESVFGRESSELLTVLVGIAESYLTLGDKERAEAALSRASAIRAQNPGQNTPGFADHLEKQALLAQAQGDLERALQAHQQAYHLREKTLGLRHPDTARSGRRIAEILMGNRHWSEAIELLKSSLWNQESLGVDPLEVARTSFLLARAMGETPTLRNLAVGYGEKAMRKYLEAEGDTLKAKQEVGDWLRKHRDR